MPKRSRKRYTHFGKTQTGRNIEILKSRDGVLWLGSGDV
jgi:hypothetical protein